MRSDAQENIVCYTNSGMLPAVSSTTHTVGKESFLGGPKGLGQDGGRELDENINKVGVCLTICRTATAG